MTSCKTIKIQAGNKQGFIVINQNDFDAKTHKEFKEQKAERKVTKKKPQVK